MNSNYYQFLLVLLLLFSQSGLAKDKQSISYSSDYSIEKTIDHDDDCLTIHEFELDPTPIYSSFREFLSLNLQVLPALKVTIRGPPHILN